MHAISLDFVAWTNLLHNQVFASRDVGDKYFTFQSLDARNLLCTDVRYNFPVCFFSKSKYDGAAANAIPILSVPHCFPLEFPQIYTDLYTVEVSRFGTSFIHHHMECNMWRNSYLELESPKEVQNFANRLTSALNHLS